MKVYILTDSERTWDCIVGVFKTKGSAELAASEYSEEGVKWEDYMVIHEKELED